MNISINFTKISLDDEVSGYDNNDTEKYDISRKEDAIIFKKASFLKSIFLKPFLIISIFVGFFCIVAFIVPNENLLLGIAVSGMLYFFIGVPLWFYRCPKKVKINNKTILVLNFLGIPTQKYLIEDIIKKKIEHKENPVYLFLNSSENKVITMYSEELKEITILEEYLERVKAKDKLKKAREQIVYPKQIIIEISSKDTRKNILGKTWLLSDEVGLYGNLDYISGIEVFDRFRIEENKEKVSVHLIKRPKGLEFKIPKFSKSISVGVPVKFIKRIEISLVESKIIAHLGNNNKIHFYITKEGTDVLDFFTKHYEEKLNPTPVHH